MSRQRHISSASARTATLIAMDRRKVIVGGGAAALATTLAAAGLRSAQASTIGAGPTPTADHARRVLGLVNVDLGVVNPTGLENQLAQSLAAYRASAPRDPNANDLEAWTRQRMVNLCGTDSFQDAVTKIPQTRTLLAFSLVAYSQHQDIQPPKIARSMPVPATLARLEPDFLPELLSQINVKSKGSATFTTGLQTGTAELDRLVTTASTHGTISPHVAIDVDGGFVVAVIALVLAYFDRRKGP
jgi:hypothetical protein